MGKEFNLNLILVKRTLIEFLAVLGLLLIRT